MSGKNSQLEPQTVQNIENFASLTILVIVYESVRGLDVSKASDDLSRYAVRLLKKNIVDFEVDYYLRMTQMSRKSKTFPKNDFYFKFRILDE